MYPLPELIKFINKNIKKKDWSYCERYMKINDKKIEKRMPIGDKFYSGSYVNGIVLNIVDDKIVFIAYTLVSDNCVMSHESWPNIDAIA